MDFSRKPADTDAYIRRQRDIQHVRALNAERRLEDKHKKAVLDRQIAQEMALEAEKDKEKALQDKKVLAAQRDKAEEDKERAENTQRYFPSQATGDYTEQDEKGFEF